MREGEGVKNAQVLGRQKVNVCPSSKGGQTLTWYLADYFFLWVAQRFDFPDAKLLHGLPSFGLID